MKNPKAKGGAYERELCKTLSLWITKNERKDILWRSTASGAQFTSYRKKGSKSYTSQVSDIAAIDKLGAPFCSAFSVELKHYKDLQAGNLIFNVPGTLEKFWETHCKLSKSVNRDPILIARQNRKPDLIMLSDKFLPLCLAKLEEEVYIRKLKAFILPLKRFLETYSYEELMAYIGCN